MAAFDPALGYVLVNEGGYVLTDAEHDNGHVTFAGLTMATVSAYFGQPVSQGQMATLSRATVAAIYRARYWTPIGGDALAQQIVATCLLDMSVLMGPVRASMIAQTALGLVSDGVVGPKTRAALDAVGISMFVAAFVGGCEAFLRQIVQKDASQQGWLAGWLKRTGRMHTLRQI